MSYNSSYDTQANAILAAIERIGKRLERIEKQLLKLEEQHCPQDLRGKDSALTVEDTENLLAQSFGKGRKR